MSSSDQVRAALLALNTSDALPAETLIERGETLRALAPDVLAYAVQHLILDAAKYRMQALVWLGRKPLDDDQALAISRKHLDKGLSWAPHITRCTDLEIRALIRAVEAAHGIAQTEQPPAGERR